MRALRELIVLVGTARLQKGDRVRRVKSGYFNCDRKKTHALAELQVATKHE